MKIASYLAGNEAGLGVVTGDSIVPIHNALPADARTMIGLIAQWDALKGQVQAIAERGEGALPLASVTLLAPVSRPGKILAIGLNYTDHIEEAGLAKPEIPTWFCKHNNTVNGPYAPVEIPKTSDKVDYEVELVVVIGKGGKHISKEDAPNHVFGYCVGNDVSVRDWQLATPQWMMGKSFDTHGPFGPWITTADAIGDPHRLGVRCLVNGEQRQSSNTSYLLFKVWDMIEHLSKAMTLEPGDLIFTGTPAGVGWLSQPQTILKAGDVVRCEIDELGFIENAFADER